VTVLPVKIGGGGDWLICGSQIFP